MVQSNNWEFFVHNQGGPFHMFRGSGHYDQQYSYDPLATCAGDGFGIAALVVGAYRGYYTDDGTGTEPPPLSPLGKKPNLPTPS